MEVPRYAHGDSSMSFVTQALARLGAGRRHRRPRLSSFLGSGHPVAAIAALAILGVGCGDNEASLLPQPASVDDPIVSAVPVTDSGWLDDSLVEPPSDHLEPPSQQSEPDSGNLVVNEGHADSIVTPYLEALVDYLISDDDMQDQVSESKLPGAAQPERSSDPSTTVSAPAQDAASSQPAAPIDETSDADADSSGSGPDDDIETTRHVYSGRTTGPSLHYNTERLHKVIEGLPHEDIIKHLGVPILDVCGYPAPSCLPDPSIDPLDAGGPLWSLGRSYYDRWDLVAGYVYDACDDYEAHIIMFGNRAGDAR